MLLVARSVVDDLGSAERRRGGLPSMPVIVLLVVVIAFVALWRNARVPSYT